MRYINLRFTYLLTYLLFRDLRVLLYINMLHFVVCSLNK